MRYSIGGAIRGALLRLMSGQCEERLGLGPEEIPSYYPVFVRREVLVEDMTRQRPGIER